MANLRVSVSWQSLHSKTVSLVLDGRLTLSVVVVKSTCFLGIKKHHCCSIGLLSYPRIYVMNANRAVEEAGFVWTEELHTKHASPQTLSRGLKTLLPHARWKVEVRIMPQQLAIPQYRKCRVGLITNPTSSDASQRV